MLRVISAAMMEKRCDQTSHCQDESDEKDCNLIMMKNYNKNIAPFSVDKTTEEVKAVKVVTSAKYSKKQCKSGNKT